MKYCSKCDTELDEDKFQMKEIEKCDVVCANCHRKLHFGLIKPD